MSRQIIVGLATEGPTDIRFLESIVRRTFNDVAMKDCAQDVEVYIHIIDANKIGLSFAEYVKQASLVGVRNYGIMSLAIHTDGDRDSYIDRHKNKIGPAQELLNQEGEECCKLLTPIIPIKMMEAWMLADKQLFKDEIGTTMSDLELGINKAPETISNPKSTIEEAIRIATAHLPKRRQRLSISELYSIIGDTISLEKLLSLESYRKFQDSVRNTYRVLHYLY